MAVLSTRTWRPKAPHSATVGEVTEIRAVGFDLDGTLFDHRGSATAGVNAFLRSLDVDPSDEVRELWFAAEEEEFERWRAGHISFQEQRRRRLLAVLPVLGVVIDESPDGLDVLFEGYLSEYRAAWRPFPDVIGALASLRAQSLRLGILTNGNEEQQLDKLNAIGLDDAVDVICISEKIGAQKPSQVAFEILAQKLDVAPGECLFVGDNPRQDIDGARAAGMKSMLIERYREDAEDLPAIIRAAFDSA